MARGVFYNYPDADHIEFPQDMECYYKPQDDEVKHPIGVGMLVRQAYNVALLPGWICCKPCYESWMLGSGHPVEVRLVQPPPKRLSISGGIYG